MKSILIKEIHAFFSSLIGFLAIGIFVGITGFMIWFFPTYSVLNYGYSSLEMFFSLAPILLLIIIPAITMRLLSEEKQSGTIEWIFTKPLTDWDIILGKYFASIALIIISLIPTLIYYFSIYQLGLPKGNIDNGGVMGSYIGLIMLSGVFCAIGLFASSATTNQIVAFIMAAVLSAFCFWGFDLVSNFASFDGMPEYIIKNIGISYHYDSISRGVLDTRDIIYFGSIIFVFLYFTFYNLEKRKY
jgi:ABC-2 type transport system permease protein